MTNVLGTVVAGLNLTFLLKAGQKLPFFQKCQTELIDAKDAITLTLRYWKNFLCTLQHLKSLSNLSLMLFILTFLSRDCHIDYLVTKVTRVGYCEVLFFHAVCSSLFPPSHLQD